MSERTQAYIDTTAFNHNLRAIRAQAPKSKVLAMVKGNAYGHGLIAMGNILKDVDAFGVACLAEAIKLREAGVITPIVIMSGVFNEEDIRQIQFYNLQIVVHETFQVELLQKAKITQPVTVWLKIDTGMHRLGFEPTKFKQAYEALANCPNISQPILLMTHLADADDIRKSTTQEQLNKFNFFTAGLIGPKSIANSAGVIAWPDAIAEWNRPGIMLYGVSPIQNHLGTDHGLLPVMTLKSKIVAIHDFKKGDAIGYGGCWTCPEDMRVAAVAIGYGDGYPRHAKSGTPTLVNGQICPLVGRVSMDLVTIDLRPAAEAKIGDDVILWGRGLPVEVVAKYADTIAYELLCNVSQRVVFVYR